MTTNDPTKKPRTAPGQAAIKYWTLFCMIAFILACYGVLVYQLYVWQVRDAESYRAEAVTQQLKDTTLPAAARLDLQRQRQAAGQEQHGMEHRGRPFLHF